MPYKDDLSKETAPKRRTLLPVGWRQFKITFGEEKTSKAGNKMFVLTCQDEETKYPEDVYVVLTPGKRWILKQLLEALGIEVNKNGEFVYELSDLLNKDVLGEVIHEDNTWINRQGESVTTKQHKIVGFKAYTANPNGVTSADDIAWKD
jgi:hypothetical protein